MADIIATFRRLMDKANYYASSAQWELAENCFREIQKLYEDERLPVSMEVDLYLNLARVAGFQGKHQDAIEALTKAANVQGTNDKQKCQIYGELGINYNRTDRTLEAADMFQRQFDLSTKMAFEMDAETCRAAGNLGHTHLQLYMRHTKAADQQNLLCSAISLQAQRVEMAQTLMAKLQGWRNIHGSRNMHGFSQSWINFWLGKLWLWGVIGISRSVLTYIAAGQLKNALASGHQAVEMTKDAAGADPTIRSLSRFMYGHALLHSGDVANAKIQFNYPHASIPGIVGVCTPAIALCRESSAEHRLYLQEVIRHGVDLTAYDEQGYSALDYAVFSNDLQAVDMIKEGLSSQLDVQSIAQAYKMAQIRRHFREIFHSRFRPIIQNGHTHFMRDLRSEYAELLSAQAEKRQWFDRLRAVRYADFKNHAALPHWSSNTNHLTMEYEQIRETRTREPLLVFFSYRWIGQSQDSDKRSPDNDRHYQYRRMVDALEQLLMNHPEVDEQDLYIWLDSACIDQEDQEPGRRERGINSLPIIIAQCDVMISVVDAEYHERAWCAVETLMFKTLRESSKSYLWYEHITNDSNNIEPYGSLQNVPLKIERNIRPGSMALSVESDRRYINFLQRQTMLIGKVL